MGEEQMKGFFAEPALSGMRLLRGVYSERDSEFILSETKEL